MSRDKIDMVLDELDLAKTNDEKRLVLKKFSLKAFVAGNNSKLEKKAGYNMMHRMLNMLKP